MDDEYSKEDGWLFDDDERTFLDDLTPKEGWLPPIVLNYEEEEQEELPFPNRDEIHAELLIATLPHLGRVLKPKEKAFLYTLQEAYNLGLSGDVFTAGGKFDEECYITRADSWYDNVIEHFFAPITSHGYNISKSDLETFVTKSIDVLVDLEMFRDGNGEIVPARAEEVKTVLERYTQYNPFDDPAFVDLIGFYIQNGGKFPEMSDFRTVQRDHQLLNDIKTEELLPGEKQILYGLVKFNHLLTVPQYVNGQGSTYNGIMTMVTIDGMRLEKLTDVECILLQELLDLEYKPATTNNGYARAFVCNNDRCISEFLETARLLVTNDDYVGDPKTYNQLREDAKRSLFETGVRAPKRDLVLDMYDRLKEAYPRE